MALAGQGLGKAICGNSLFMLKQKLKAVKCLAKAWSKELANSAKLVEVSR